MIIQLTTPLTFADSFTTVTLTHAEHNYFWASLIDPVPNRVTSFAVYGILDASGNFVPFRPSAEHIDIIADDYTSLMAANVTGKKLNHFRNDDVWNLHQTIKARINALKIPGPNLNPGGNPIGGKTP